MDGNEKFKILMIDDEQDILSFFKKTFSNFKHIEFSTADRAQKGIEIAREMKPGVIMIDLRMPGMNGEQALRELKEFLPDTKFVVMTGWDDPVVQERIETEIGVSGYFGKPIDFERVISKVLSLVMVKDKSST